MAAWKAVPSSIPTSGPRSPDPISSHLQQWPRPSASLSPPKSLPSSPPLQPAGSAGGVDSYGATLYKTELCRSFADTGYCRYGLKCRFAHGQADLRPVTRHKKYKTEKCKNYSKDGSCPYGPRCRFIHEPEEALAGMESGSPPSPELMGAISPSEGATSPPLRGNGSSSSRSSGAAVSASINITVPSSSPGGHAVIGTPGRSPMYSGTLAAGSPYLSSGGLGGLAIPPVLNLAASSAGGADRSAGALLSPHAATPAVSVAAATAASSAGQANRSRALSDVPSSNTSYNNNNNNVFGRHENMGSGSGLPPQSRSAPRDTASLFSAPVFNPQPVNTVFGFEPSPSPTPSGSSALLAGTFALPRSPSPPPVPSPTGGTTYGSGGAGHHDVSARSFAPSSHYSALTTQLHSREEIVFTQASSMAHPMPMRMHRRTGTTDSAHPTDISREPSVQSEDGMDRLGQDLGRVLDGTDSPITDDHHGGHHYHGHHHHHHHHQMAAPAPRRAPPPTATSASVRSFMSGSSSLPLSLEAQGHVPSRFGGGSTTAGSGLTSTWPSVSSASVPSTPATGPRPIPSAVSVALASSRVVLSNGNDNNVTSGLRRQLLSNSRRAPNGDEDDSAQLSDEGDPSSAPSSSPEHDDDDVHRRRHHASSSIIVLDGDDYDDNDNNNNNVIRNKHVLARSAAAASVAAGSKKSSVVSSKQSIRGI